MKMFSDRLRRCEDNTNPLINKVPQATEEVTMNEKMTHGLRAATPTRTNSIVMQENSPTKKIIFGGESVAK
jgi:hypothetical protein